MKKTSTKINLNPRKETKAQQTKNRLTNGIKFKGNDKTKWNRKKQKKHRLQEKLDERMDGSFAKSIAVTLHWLHENHWLFIDISIKILIKKDICTFVLALNLNTFMQCGWCMVCPLQTSNILSHTHHSRWLDTTDPRKMLWNKNDINIHISTNKKYTLYELDGATKVTFYLSMLLSTGDEERWRPRIQIAAGETENRTDNYT